MPQIAHFIPYLGTAMGGPVQSMSAYADLVVNLGFTVGVYSTSQFSDGQSVRLNSSVPSVQEPVTGWGSFRRSPGLWRQAQAANIELVHSHCLWTDVNRLAADIARRRRLPHLLTPCGMLAPGALQHRWWKKLPVRLWFQNRALREAQCLHAKSGKEYEDIRRFGLKNPVAIIPNPIQLPAKSQSVSGEGFRSLFDIPPEKNILLYLGRMHPVKGLPRLIQAWAAVPEYHAQWLLVLAGPDDQGNRSNYETMVRQAGCETSIRFTGELNNLQKWNALASAKLFVMPSDFENFGSAIVEALHSGLPVITTTGTPWKDLPTASAGWWIEPTAVALTATLRSALQLPEEKMLQMSRNATQFAGRFRPEQAAADLVQVYQWLLGKASKPNCIIIT